MLTHDIMRRLAHSMLYQNKYAKPTGHNNFNAAYVVGKHIFFNRIAAQEWVDQVVTDAEIECISYREVYEYAKTLKII